MTYLQFFLIMANTLAEILARHSKERKELVRSSKEARQILLIMHKKSLSIIPEGDYGKISRASEMIKYAAQVVELAQDNLAMWKLMERKA